MQKIQLFHGAHVMDTKVAGDTGTREYIGGDDKFDGDGHVYYQS